MAEQKTQPGTGNIDDFVAALVDDQKRADAAALIQMMARVSGEPPVLWGTMIGFGRYHYRYDSEHEGDAFLIGFAPRRTEFSLYLMGCYLPGADAERADLLARLGKHRMGKACLYVKRLSDIDSAVLEELAAMSVTRLRQTYPQ